MLDNSQRSDPNGSLDNLGALPGPNALPTTNSLTPPPATPTTLNATTPISTTPEQLQQSQQPQVQMYEVQSGDTLTSIAQRFYGSGAKYPLIENANPGLDSYSLRIGKKIRIPPAAGEAAAVTAQTGGETFYTVQEGDYVLHHRS